MPKEVIQIKTFNGMIGVADTRDLPQGSAAYARNLNMITQVGAFEGLPEDLSWGFTAAGGGKYFTPYKNGDAAVYWNGTTVRILNDLDGTPADVVPTDEYGDNEATQTGSQVGISDGEYVRVGMGPDHAPIWVGEPLHGLFGVAAPGNPLKTAAYLLSEPLNDQITVSGSLNKWLVDFTIVTTEDPEAVVYTFWTALEYYASITYDGYQEGPLIHLGDVLLAILTGVPPEVGYSSVTLTIRVITGGASATSEQILSKRATAINIYRFVGTLATTNSFNPNYLGYLVESIDLTSATGWSNTSWDGGNMVGKEYDVVDTGQSGRTYEERTGINPTITDFKVNYGISALADSYHIVGDISHQDIGAKPAMLLRSKYGRYDTFDWSVDWLTLPTEPRAMEYYGGRLYVFGRGFTYVVNPESFIIEDTWEGIGAFAQQSVTKTDRGLFWADESNIYWHNGASMQPIAMAIMDNQHPSYGHAGYANSNVSESNPPTLFYSARYDSLIIWYKYSTLTYGWMYHIDTGRWVHLSSPVNGVVGGSFVGPDGIPRFMINLALYSFCDHATSLRDWVWISNNIVSEPGGWHVYYHALVSYRGTTIDGTTLDYYENDPYFSTPISWSPSAETTGMFRGVVNNYGGSGEWNKSRNFALRLIDSGDVTVTDVTLIRRRITPR